MKKILVSVAVIPFLISCAATDVDKVRDGQMCLDKITVATAANARTCIQKVSGVNSAAASLIRCSALLTVQGLNDPNTLVSVLAGMTSANTLTMMAMGFQANGVAATDESDANTAVTECNNSGSTSLVMLAAMAHAGTYAKYAGGCTITIVQPPAAPVNAANLLCVKTYANATYAATSAVATALYTAYQLNCTSTSPTVFCTQYKTAITAAGGVSNLLAVATSFFTNAN